MMIFLYILRKPLLYRNTILLNAIFQQNQPNNIQLQNLFYRLFRLQILSCFFEILQNFVYFEEIIQIFEDAITISQKCIARKYFLFNTMTAQ